MNQFNEALESFKRAYWNYEDPTILYNIAQCHRALKHKSEAIDFYRSYLRKAENAPNREEVQKIIAELEAAIEKERAIATSPPQGTINAENKPAVETKAPAETTTAINSRKMEKRKSRRAWIWGIVAGVVGASAIAIGVGVGVGTQAHPPKAADGSVSF